MNIYVVTTLFVLLMMFMAWVIYRQDKRIEDVMDRFMAMSDTLAQYKINTNPADETWAFIDQETGEMRPVTRGSGASTEDIEGTP